MLNVIIITILFALIIWLGRGLGKNAPRDSNTKELVPDALTGVYFPKTEAVSINRAGETLYFLTIENRDKYLISGR